MEIKDKEPLW